MLLKLGNWVLIWFIIVCTRLWLYDYVFKYTKPDVGIILFADSILIMMGTISHASVVWQQRIACCTHRALESIMSSTVRFIKNTVALV